MSPSLIGVCHAKLSISLPIPTGIKNRLVVFVRRICGFIHNPNEKKQGSIRSLFRRSMRRISPKSNNSFSFFCDEFMIALS